MLQYRCVRDSTKATARLYCKKGPATFDGKNAAREDQDRSVYLCVGVGAKPSVQTDDDGRPDDEGCDPQDMGHHIVQQEQQKEGDRVVGARQDPSDFLWRVTYHHDFTRRAAHGTDSTEQRGNNELG